MTRVHHSDPTLRDAVVGFCADGSAIELAIARRIEISWVRDGFASITLTRFFRSFEAAPINVVLTLLSPPGAIMWGPSARIGKNDFVLALETPEKARKPMRVSYMPLQRGAHVVTLRSIPLANEVQIEARILAQLSFSGESPRLPIPMAFADVFLMGTLKTVPIPEERAIAVLLVSPQSGLALLHGRPVGDAPVIVAADEPLELIFPDAQTGFLNL
ncbi:hypothetical protein [Methylocystis sp. ATCC 49242]|uniref:hypothetical protein n=1 Tax=Methylocystis sp. ATCC 49242 TaxID=622637 RepID=UPI0001F88821|nr:hypothetical protein [Methylocystis sp. ATCC 49242]